MTILVHDILRDITYCIIWQYQLLNHITWHYTLHYMMTLVHDIILCDIIYYVIWQYHLLIHVTWSYTLCYMMTLVPDIILHDVIYYVISINERPWEFWTGNLKWCFTSARLLHLVYVFCRQRIHNAGGYSLWSVSLLRQPVHLSVDATHADLVAGLWRRGHAKRRQDRRYKAKHESFTVQHE